MLTPEVFSSFMPKTSDERSLSRRPERKRWTRWFVFSSLCAQFPGSICHRVKTASTWLLTERKLAETAALRESGKGERAKGKNPPTPKPLWKVFTVQQPSPPMSADWWQDAIVEVLTWTKCAVFICLSKLGGEKSLRSGGSTRLDTWCCTSSSLVKCWLRSGWGVAVVSAVLRAELWAWKEHRLMQEVACPVLTQFCVVLHAVGYDRSFALKGWEDYMRLT